MTTGGVIVLAWDTGLMGRAEGTQQIAEPTTGEIFKAKAILEEDLVAAVKAQMDNPLKGAHRLGDSYTLDLAAAVFASPFAVDMLADPSIKDASKRSAVRTAILLARPVKR